MALRRDPGVQLHGFRPPPARGYAPPVPSEREDPPAATVYDLLRALVVMTAWHTEDEQRAYMDAVNAAERIGVFGNMATQLELGRDGRV